VHEAGEPVITYDFYDEEDAAIMRQEDEEKVAAAEGSQPDGAVVRLHAVWPLLLGRSDLPGQRFRGRSLRPGDGVGEE
jgi:hypothetical protein